MVFGITETGDASINYEWVEKISEVDGCILITKKLTNKFINTVLPLKNKKIILHISCTGYGQTVLEPNCPKYEDTISKIKFLIDNGWKATQIVLRIDPIIPTKKGILLFESIVKMAREIIPEVTRIRISVLDMYKHVQKRFKNHELPILYNNYFSASKTEFEALDIKIQELKGLYPSIHIESCAEIKLPHSEALGCVSERDFEIGKKRAKKELFMYLC